MQSVVLNAIGRLAIAGALSALLVTFSLSPTHDAVFFPLALLFASGAYITAISLSLLATLLVLPFILSTFDIPVEVVYAIHVLQAILAIVFAVRGSLLAPPIRGPNTRVPAAVLRILRGTYFLAAAYAAILLCFREFAVVYASSWAATFATFGVALTRSSPVLKPAWKMWAVNTALLLVSTALAIGFVEGASRLLLEDKFATRSYYGPDSTYIFLLKPNTTGKQGLNVSATETVQFDIEVSSQGFRDELVGEKEPGEFRILMLGDSFTMGYGVHPEETIPHFLEQELEQREPGRSFRVVNGGVAGGGAFQHLGMWRRFGRKIQPDLVIYQFFTGNDFEDTLESVGKHLRATNPLWERFAYKRRHQAHPAYRTDTWLTDHSHIYRVIRAATKYEPWVGDFLTGVRFLPQLEPEQHVPSADRNFALESDLKNWYPELEESFALMREYVLAIRDEAREDGADFAAFVIPPQQTLDDEMWERQTAVNPELYERGKATRVIREFLESEGIPYIDVYNALRKWPVLATHHAYDAHLDKRGNSLVARVIADHLVRSYFPAGTDD